MAIDPNVEASLKVIEHYLDSIEEDATHIQEQITLIRQGDVPPPPTDTPITITSAKSERTGPTIVTINYTIGGTLSRATQLATAIDKITTSWKTYPAPTNSTGSIFVTVPASLGNGRIWFHVFDSKKKAQNGSNGDWVIVPVDFVSYVDPNPDPNPNPVPGGTGSFTFGQLDGNTSILKDGKLFIPRGFNMPGPNGYWGGGYSPVGKATTLRDGPWHVNLIRLFEQDPGGGECSACPSAHNPWSIDDVVREYTAAGIVVMIDYHQFDFGRSYSQTQTNKMLEFWSPLATRYKDNPLVWFNLANEPENDAGGSDTPGMANRWFNAFAPVIDMIRSTGAKNMIVIDDGNAGQGCSDFFHMVQSSGSAIMLRGADLVKRDPTGNIMWDMHSYDNMGWLAPGEANNNCANRYTNEQRDARFTDYIKRVWQATGRPVLIGEFGWRVGDKIDSGSGFHYPYTTCGSRTYAGQQSFTRNGDKLNTGGTQWTGFQVTYSGADAYSSENLTECGQDFMAFCRRAFDKESAQSIVPSPLSLAGDALDLLQLTRPRRRTLVEDPDDILH